MMGASTQCFATGLINISMFLAEASYQDSYCFHVISICLRHCLLHMSVVRFLSSHLKKQKMQQDPPKKNCCSVQVWSRWSGGTNYIVPCLTGLFVHVTPFLSYHLVRAGLRNSCGRAEAGVWLVEGRRCDSASKTL